MGADVAVAFLPRAAVRDERDPGVRAQAEMVAASADVSVPSQLLVVETDAAARTVGG